MDPSGSGGPPMKRSFPVGTRVGAHTISKHVCFFCGATFPQSSDYQRHIVHEHQMASIAYQLYTEEHPIGMKREGKKERKRAKEEGKKEEKRKEENGEEKRNEENVEQKREEEHGEDKRQKMDESSSYSPLPSSSRSTHQLSITAPPSSSFSVPSPHPKSLPSLPPPLLPAGRYPANKQRQSQFHSSAGEGTSKAPVRERTLVEGPSRSISETPCAVCNAPFRNATELVVHNIRMHEARIGRIEITHHYGDQAVDPELEFEFSEECEQCGVKTPTYTQCFEHSITYHKASAFIGTDATSVTYKATTIAQPNDLTFDVRIRLKRTITTKN